MDNLYCNGNESALHHCQFDGWKVHDCTTNEVAGVICQTGQPNEIRGGSNSIGRTAAVTLNHDSDDDSDIIHIVPARRIPVTNVKIRVSVVIVLNF